MGKLAARKNAILKAVCTAPSFNKTPIGASTPPVPYPTTQNLANSVAVTLSVRFNGDPAYVLSKTQQLHCRGDDAGVAGGVKSGTVNGFVRPTSAAHHYRAEGKFVVRAGDANVMNGGNNPGVYVAAPHPGASSGLSGAGDEDSSVAVEAETQAEAAFLNLFGQGLQASHKGVTINTMLLAMAALAAKASAAPAPLVRFVPGKRG